MLPKPVSDDVVGTAPNPSGSFGLLPVPLLSTMQRSDEAQVFPSELERLPITLENVM
jgi:hypothetical protein